LPAQKRKRPRGVVDTSVLVAGIAGFKSAGFKSTEIVPKNPSANLLRDWIEGDTFVWLVSDEILLNTNEAWGRPASTSNFLSRGPVAQAFGLAGITNIVGGPVLRVLGEGHP
jgi:hypothetical protein